MPNRYLGAGRSGRTQAGVVHAGRALGSASGDGAFSPTCPGQLLPSTPPAHPAPPAPQAENMRSDTPDVKALPTGATEKEKLIPRGLLAASRPLPVPPPPRHTSTLRGFAEPAHEEPFFSSKPCQRGPPAFRWKSLGGNPGGQSSAVGGDLGDSSPAPSRGSRSRSPGADRAAAPPRERRRGRNPPPRVRGARAAPAGRGNGPISPGNGLKR